MSSAIQKGKIRVTRAITINLGNYESLRLEASVEEENTSFDRLWKKVTDELEGQIVKDQSLIANNSSFKIH
jgi:hypothetical protein